MGIWKCVYLNLDSIIKDNWVHSLKSGAAWSPEAWLMFLCSEGPMSHRGYLGKMSTQHA